MLPELAVCVRYSPIAFVVFRVRIQVSALSTAARPFSAPADRRVFVTYWPTVASVFFFIIEFVYDPRSVEIIAKTFR